MQHSELPKPRQPEILAYRSPPEHGEFTSGALKNIVHKLGSTQQKVSVLDLGPCSQGMLELFSAQGVRVVFEDLSSELENIHRPLGSSEQRLPVDAYLTPQPDASTYDFVTAWDLLNYLDPDRVQELFSSLHDHCHPETFVYALLSTLTRMPKEPGRFTLAEGAIIRYELCQRHTRACPRYSPRDIERLLPQFEIDRLMLLKNGFYEIIFRPR
jgi:2-polyprenyl-3-methyl-5-hydroxy-6-metoxy-1,4-benzoquinol methylase